MQNIIEKLENKIKAQQESINCLIQEIKGMQRYIQTLEKNLNQSIDCINSNAKTNEKNVERNSNDIYSMKIKQDIHMQMLNKAEPIIEIAEPMSKHGFRLMTLENQIKEIIQNLNDIQTQQATHSKALEYHAEGIECQRNTLNKVVTNLDELQTKEASHYLEYKLNADEKEELINTLKKQNDKLEKEIETTNNKTLWEIIKARLY